MWVPDISFPLLLVRLGSTNGNVSTGRVCFRVLCDLHGRTVESIKSAGGKLHWWFNLSYGWLHLGLCNQLGKTPGRVCQSTLDHWNALSNIKYYGNPGNPLCQFPQPVKLSCILVLPNQHLSRWCVMYKYKLLLTSPTQSVLREGILKQGSEVWD